MNNIRLIVAIFIMALGAAASVLGQNEHTRKEIEPGKTEAKTGILLLAHGGKDTWNGEVKKISEIVGQKIPIEVAFGMASRRSIQQAVDKLAARGVSEIVAVPLFISSHSSVITSTEYLLGLRKQAPDALAIFAKMDHGDGGHGTHQPVNKSFDPTTPVKSPIPIRMLPALNRHPLVAEILLSRAARLSRQPEKEVVVVIAHGPVSDEENKRWLADMASLTDHMRGQRNFKRIEFLTVRDDAPEPIRSRATAELRRVVEGAVREGNRVLIVPLLLAYGGIEEGIRKRLEGLEYIMSDQALLPDERLARWVLQSVKDSSARQ